MSSLSSLCPLPVVALPQLESKVRKGSHWLCHCHSLQPWVLCLQHGIGSPCSHLFSPHSLIPPLCEYEEPNSKYTGQNALGRAWVSCSVSPQCVCSCRDCPLWGHAPSEPCVLYNCNPTPSAMRQGELQATLNSKIQNMWTQEIITVRKV